MKKLLILAVFLLAKNLICINDSTPQASANPQVKKQKKTSSIIPVVQMGGTAIYYLLTKVEFIGTGAFLIAFNLIKNLYFSKVDTSDFKAIKQEFELLKQNFKAFEEESSTKHDTTINKVDSIAESLTKTNNTLNDGFNQITKSLTNHANAFTEEVEKHEKTSLNTNNYLAKMQSKIIEVQDLIKEETSERKNDDKNSKDSIGKINNLITSLGEDISELKHIQSERKEQFSLFKKEDSDWKNIMQEEHKNLLNETKNTSERVGKVLDSLEKHFSLTQNNQN